MLSACRLIDDDLSVCGEDLTLTYHLQLHTELRVQLQAELSAEPELPVRQALEQWLAPVFDSEEMDVDLRFYSQPADRLAHRLREVLRADHKRYIIRLPKENYMHLALARSNGDGAMTVQQDESAATMMLCMPEQQELSSLRTGIYTTRMPIQVTDSVGEIDVNLYMVTSAVALVTDASACADMRSMRAEMSGAASGFAIQDSTYSFAGAPVLLFDDVPVTAIGAAPLHRVTGETKASYACMATVGLPTEDGKEWSVAFTTTLTGDRHTTTTLTVNEPLKAGTLRIIKLEMNSDGEVVPVGNASVGASVTLDWKSGTDQEMEI